MKFGATREMNKEVLPIAICEKMSFEIVFQKVREKNKCKSVRLMMVQ